MTRHALERRRIGSVKMRGLRRALMAKYRRHENPGDPFTLPTYRHPQARRQARRERQAAGV